MTKTNKIIKRYKISEFYPNYEALIQTPIILEDLSDDWPASKKWSFDFFKTHYGNVSVTARKTHNINGFQEIRIKDYLHYLHTTNDTDPSYIEWAFESTHPKLAEDLKKIKGFANWLDYLPKTYRPSTKWIFIGATNTGTPLHFDTWNTSTWNFLAQGQKTWIFFPPTDNPFLYDGQVDVFNPDFNTYPLLQQAHPIICHQRAGDVLFVPPKWWHQVKNVQPSISVTENFINEKNYKEVMAFFKANEMKDWEMILEQITPVLQGVF